MRTSSNRIFPFKKYLIGAFFFGLCLLVYHCKNPEVVSDYSIIEPIAVHQNGETFAGSSSCIPCHAEIYNTHVETAHFNTSTIADSTTIKGSFEPEKNTHILNNRVRFTMMATDSGFYQKANFTHNQLELSNLRFDIVVGSGTKGQSYLSWENNELFQLHTSYFTPVDRWTRSPGLKEFRSPRPVIARCLECHTTYAKSTNEDKAGNRFERNQIIYGIDCERCHGPSAKHVGYHQKNPNALASKYMAKQTSLSKQQRLDICALCHSGGRKPIQPPFSFLVGDNLSQFSEPETTNMDTSLDVHGNQYELLTRSSCFKKSEIMDCTTCHNPHKNQRGDFQTFNQICVGCHSPPQVLCKVKEESASIEMGNCISCHMPLFPSSTMVMQLDSIKTAVKVRTHLIDIYP